MICIWSYWMTTKESAGRSQPTLAKRASSSPLLILAGDIGNPTDESYAYALKCASKRYPQVVVILGNHEHYNHNYEETYDLACAACFELHNVTVLQNEHFEHDDGYVVLGTTLWTPIAPNEKDCIQRYLNDFNVIQNGWTRTNTNLSTRLPPIYVFVSDQSTRSTQARYCCHLCDAPFANIQASPSRVYRFTHRQCICMFGYGRVHRLCRCVDMRTYTQGWILINHRQIQFWRAIQSGTSAKTRVMR